MGNGTYTILSYKSLLETHIAGGLNKYHEFTSLAYILYLGIYFTQVGA